MARRGYYRLMARPQLVLDLYTETEPFLTLVQVADLLKADRRSVQAVLERHLTVVQLKALQALRYSKSKLGTKNPMKGKMREAHHNWQGECENGHGYLTALHPVTGNRELVHRMVMASLLGLTALPDTVTVHHIDGDKKNNSTDNLAVLTPGGHSRIHNSKKIAAVYQLRKSHLTELVKLSTSRSKKIIAI
jgi:hypothetical protein